MATAKLHGLLVTKVEQYLSVGLTKKLLEDFPYE
jgi:hypothetical protein